MDYPDQLLSESRNNVNFHNNYIRKMPCPNRWKLTPKSQWHDPSRYEAKANQKCVECPSGENGTVEMIVQEDGIWTNIECPVCGYIDFWSIGDGDELF
jgi:hypothetical protein